MWLEQCMAIVFVGDNLYLVDKGMFFSTQVNLYEFSSINWMLKCVKFDSVIRSALCSSKKLNIKALSLDSPQLTTN